MYIAFLCINITFKKITKMSKKFININQRNLKEKAVHNENITKKKHRNTINNDIYMIIAIEHRIIIFHIRK